MPDVRDRIRRLAERWGPAAWYGGLAVLIASPLFRGGYLLLLDVSLARRVPVIWWPSPAAAGPHNDAPADFVLAALSKLGYAAGPILVFALFAGMGLAMHRAIGATLGPVRPAAALFAGTLYAVNPFTYERLMHGHVYLLMAYAVMPLALAAILRFADAPSRRSGTALLAWVLVISWTSIHLLAMLPLVFGAVLLFRRPVAWRRLALCSGGLLAVWAALNVWWIAGLAVRSAGGSIGSADLLVYATRPRSNIVLGHVAALYGFWRHEFGLPRDGVRQWWLLFAPIAGLAVSGCIAALGDRRLRWLGGWFVVLVPVAVVLAAGISFEPTRGAFEWLYRTVPGFKLFREPQKWVAVLPLAYAITAALGLEALLGRGSGRGRDTLGRRGAALVTAIALLVPLLYGRTLLANWDRLTPSRFPADWAQVDRLVRQDPGPLLFLPWHLYISLGFTGRRVANPAPAYFSVPVLSGDNVEVEGIRTQSQNPRSAEIERALFTDRSRLPATLAKLCISWVVLAKEDDYRSYEWVRALPGLRPAFEGPTIALFVFDPPPGCSHA